jgi:hypothetical protein
MDHDIKLSEMRYIRKAGEVEQGVAYRFRRFIRRFGNAISDFVYFTIHGLKMFSMSILQGLVGIFEGVAGLVNFVIDGTRKMLARIVRGITEFVNGVITFAVSLIKGVLTFFILFGKSIITFVKRAVEFVYTSSHKAEHEIKLTERRAFRRLYDEISEFARSSAKGTRTFFDSLVYLILHDAKLAERRYARRVIRTEHNLISRLVKIVREFLGGLVELVRTLIHELKRMFKSLVSRFGKLFEFKEAAHEEEEPSESVLPEGFDFDNRDILSLSAEKFKLKQYLKKLDLEYTYGTLDTRGYLRTRENLLKELWKLRH